MSKVLVERELLERLLPVARENGMTEWNPDQVYHAVKEIQDVIAQPSEAEGAEVVGYVGRDARMTVDGWENGGEYLVFADQASEADKRYDVPLMTVAQHLSALSAVTAERDRLDAECGRLLEGNVQDAETIFVLESELDQLRAEVEALRKDAERLDFMVAQRALINLQNGTASPTVYRVCWPSESRQQADWYPSERDAIDAAIAQGSWS